MYHILSFGFYNLNEIYLRIKCLNNSDRVGWKRGLRWRGYMYTYGDCSHEIKRRLPPWKESYDQPR